MANETTFAAEPRSHAGKGANRGVRRQGRIPAIVYGGQEPPELISVDVPSIIKAHASGKMTSRLYQLELAGKKVRVIPREVQTDPVNDHPVHVDFMRVVPGRPVTLDIAVEFKRADESPGIKRGGVLNIVRHEVELIVDPENIPDHIEANLTGLDINDSLHISAIALPPGAKPRIARDFTVATIAAPSGHAEEVAEAAAKAAAAVAPEGAEGAPAEGAAPGAEEKKPEADDGKKK